MRAGEVKYGGVAVQDVPHCYLCNSPSAPLYKDRKDFLFEAPGSWDFRICSNSACRLIWMDPVPTPADIAKLYRNYYTHGNDHGANVSRIRQALRFIRDCYFADRYGYTGLVPPWYRPIGKLLYFFPSKRPSIDFDVMCLPALAGGSLLEIGCGSGTFLARMQRLGWNVRGVDPDPEAVSWGRQAYGLDLLCGTLESIHLPADSFDVITMNHVIEHVHDPIALLTECQRLLRPGGRLIVTTPNADSWGHKIFTGNWRGLEPPRHFMIFSLRNLEQCTRRSNLRTVKLRSISRWGRNIYIASKQIRNQQTQHLLGRAWTMLQGYTFQAGQLIAENFSIWSGEEIYFIGQKPHSGS
jgi:2-polyprenyl-3-methyl-5-hydroxy-6-metoxy-1,4-benzoquinol methylase